MFLLCFKFSAHAILREIRTRSPLHLQNGRQRDLIEQMKQIRLEKQFGKGKVTNAEFFFFLLALAIDN